MPQIKLLNMPSLDNTYENVIDFATLSAQQTWFNNKVGKIVEGNFKTDTEQEQLVLNTTYHSIKPFDYLYFQDPSGKYVYYFITNKSIKTADTCVIDIDCDVWNTYMFDYTLMDSFVERCHVPRWNGVMPTTNLVDEGLPLGEYLIEEKETLYALNKTYVMTSTTPLGKLTTGGYKPGNGGPGPGTGDVCEGDIAKGIMSSKGFRFIKGYEAFGPYAYDDGFGYMTIAYGITKHGEPDIYNQLVAKQPVAEEEGAKISYQLKIDNYGMKIKDNFLKIYTTADITKFDAVLSFAYNLGVGVMNENHSFYQALATKDEATIRTEWMKYVNAGGSPVQGLILRRKAELDIFFKGLYEFRSIPLLNANGAIVGVVEENRGDGWLPTCEGTTGSNPTGFTVQNEEGAWSCPAKGTVTATYPSYPEGGTHNGIDIANAVGTPIYAMRDGKVTVSGPVSGFGHAIYIDHGNGIIARYGHMYADQLVAKVGDTVKQGQIIAAMGNDGISTGPHLHFDFLKNGVHFNPATNMTVGQVIA